MSFTQAFDHNVLELMLNNKTLDPFTLGLVSKEWSDLTRQRRENETIVCMENNVAHYDTIMEYKEIYEGFGIILFGGDIYLV